MPHHSSENFGYIGPDQNLPWSNSFLSTTENSPVQHENAVFLKIAVIFFFFCGKHVPVSLYKKQTQPNCMTAVEESVYFYDKNEALASD